MAKISTATSEPQTQDNPIVMIRYTPDNAPLALANNATRMLATIQSAKPITNPKGLEQVSEMILDAQITSAEVETFCESLRRGIQKACERVREMPGYEDFEATLTIRKWSLRQLLNDGISKLKNSRALYLDQEEKKRQKLQFEAEEKQRKINAEAAAAAAKTAKASGADKATIAEIKHEVLATPAPLIESKAANVAAAAGATLRYKYEANCTDLRKFLVLCLNNDVMFNTLSSAKPEIEAAFRKMVGDQKETFNYAGMTFRKIPVDVQGRR